MKGCSYHKAVWVFVLCCFAFCLASPSTPESPQTGEEEALKSLVERFFTAYEKEDLEGLMSLWSEKSPDYAERKKVMKELFGFRDYTFANLIIKQIQFEGDKAKLRVCIALTEIEPKTRMQSTRNLDRIFVCVKEEGIWKIWRYYPTSEELAYALLRVETDEEREKLLAKESELVNFELVRVLLIWGDKELEQENFQRALAIYQLASKIAQRIGDEEGLILSLNREGDTLALMGQIKEAAEKYEANIVTLKGFIKSHQEVGSNQRAHDLSLLLANLLHRLGSFYQTRYGDAEKALAKYQEMLAIGKQIGDRWIEAEGHNCVGGQLIGFGKIAQGIQEMEEAIRIYEDLLRQNPNPRIRECYLVALNHLASTYSSIHLFPQAIERYEKSLKISRDIGFKIGEMGALWGIGMVYAGQGDFKKAIEHFEQSLKMAREEKHFAWIVTNLGSLADTYRELRDYDKALAYAQEQLEFAREVRSPLWEIGSLSLIISTLVRKGDTAKARIYAEEARKKLEYLGLSEEMLGAAIGDIYRAEGKWEQAIDAYLRYLAYLEQRFPFETDPQTKLLHLERAWSEVYGNLISCFLALRRYEEALQFLERAKARVLTEILRKGKVDISKNMTDGERQRERELNARIVQANAELRSLLSQRQTDQAKLDEVCKRLNSARQEYDAFRRSLYLKYPQLAFQRGEVQPLSIQQIFRWLQSVKAKDMLMLEYLVLEERIWVFAIHGSGSFQVYPIDIPRKELERRVDALKLAIRQKEEGKVGALTAFERAIRQLDILIKPVTQQINRAKQVCIVPDDILWEVPFAALKTPKSRYLVEVCSVFYAPSITSLKAMQEMKEMKKPSKTLLAMAPFAYPEGSKQAIRTIPLVGTFGPLPASLKEVSTLAKLYSVKPYLREEARESQVKAKGHQVGILHFATHAFFEPSQGLYSGIVLAEEKGEDGFLEAREIVDLNLHADLVVLSACETAKGKIHRGEGLIGLTWAFFVAGCASTVVSQWKVMDESTAELMANFYRHLRAGANKAEAVRQAQLSLLHSRKYSSPFFWAPFILLGDWR